EMLWIVEVSQLRVILDPVFEKIGPSTLVPGAPARRPALTSAGTKSAHSSSASWTEPTSTTESKSEWRSLAASVAESLSVGALLRGSPALHGVEGLLDQCRIDPFDGIYTVRACRVLRSLVQLFDKFLDVVIHPLGADQDEPVRPIVYAYR